MPLHPMSATVLDIFVSPFPSRALFESLTNLLVRLASRDWSLAHELGPAKMRRACDAKALPLALKGGRKSSCTRDQESRRC